MPRIVTNAVRHVVGPRVDLPAAVPSALGLTSSRHEAEGLR